MRTVRRLALLALAAVAAGGCIASRLNAQAFHPQSRFLLIPPDLGLDCRPFRVPVDGAVIDAWYFPAPGGRTPVLVCGGNSDNKELNLPLAWSLVRRGCPVVLFDYRGFGLSTGEPDLWALLPDAGAVFRAALERTGSDRLVLMGISLGSVVALGTAAQQGDRVEAVIVEGLVHPRHAIDELAGPFLGALGWIFVAPSGWDVEEHVTKLAPPILFLHGTRDTITPLASSASIFSASLDGPGRREFFIVDGAGHAPDLAGRLGPAYVDRLDRFLGGQPAGEGDLYERSMQALVKAEADLDRRLGAGARLFFKGQVVHIRFGEGPSMEEVRAALPAAGAELERVLAAGVHPFVLPAFAALFDDLAKAADEAGEPAAAIAAWERSFSLWPPDPFAWWRFGDARWTLGLSLRTAADALDRMAALAGDPARSAEYARRAEEMRARQAARDARLRDWRSGSSG